jgi:hypothetical protein
MAPLIAPTVLGPLIAGFFWFVLGVRLRARRELTLMAPLAATLAVAALVVVSVVAKATYSGGPEGELFRGTVGRTLAVGDRSDSGIPYTIVQLAAQGISPTSDAGEREFSPWTFYSRGPLAGLVTVPVLLATGGTPPAKWPSDPWEPYDRLGYAAYRIVLMVLASGVIVALFGALAIPLGERWALVGAGLLALSPFGVHEVMFTWPKWPATAGILLGFMLAQANRGYWAGAALAVGFFYHPMALLAAPWIALWVLARNRNNPRHGIRVLLRMTAATCVLVLPWMFLAAFTPHLPDSTHGGHSTFLRYWVLADYEPATWQTWWKSRWRNFANTFIPFRLYWVDGNHPTLNSFYGPSPPVVRFAFSWWNSLPIGLGLGLWAVSTVAIVRALRIWPAMVGLLIVGPALTITAYFGAISAGLMRECGHFLFVAIIGLTCAVAARSDRWLRRILVHPATPWLQLPETLLMLWLTTAMNRHPEPSRYNSFDVVYAVISVAALAGAAAMLSRFTMMNQELIARPGEPNR